MKGSGELREIGDILRPNKEPSAAGRESQPETLRKDWRFGIAKQTGRQMEIARQMVPLVTHVLEGWHPGVEVESGDYVLWKGKRLNIEFPNGEQNNGRQMMLVCIEQA